MDTRQEKELDDLLDLLLKCDEDGEREDMKTDIRAFIERIENGAWEDGKEAGEERAYG